MGALRHQVLHADLVSGFRQIVIVVGREHGDGEDAQFRPRACFYRRPHGLRIGVHGEEGHAKRGHACDALLDRIADVVQFHIEEDLLARSHQTLRKSEPSGEGQLIADLVKAYGVAEALDHRFGLAD